MGQREVSFTTPDANMSLKSSQRVSQKVTRSCSLTPRDPLIKVRGATRIQRNPVSRSRLSLKSKQSKQEERLVRNCIYNSAAQQQRPCSTLIKWSTLSSCCFRSCVVFRKKMNCIALTTGSRGKPGLPVTDKSLVRNTVTGKNRRAHYHRAKSPHT